MAESSCVAKIGNVCLLHKIPEDQKGRAYTIQGVYTTAEGGKGLWERLKDIVNGKNYANSPEHEACGYGNLLCR